jgi:hypothetical protein
MSYLCVKKNIIQIRNDFKVQHVEASEIFWYYKLRPVYFDNLWS